MTKEAVNLAAAAKPRKGAARRDVARNKAALLQATGELLMSDPSAMSMPAVAERAGLSVATAYRYFPSLESLQREYALDVVERLARYSQALDLDGEDLFEAVLGKWLEIVIEFGPALVLIRSREGLLARRARGERHAGIIDAAWGRPVRSMMEQEEVASDLYERALAHCNALLNSRELLDLHRTSSRSPARLVRDLTAVYRGTLQGLATIA